MIQTDKKLGWLAKNWIEQSEISTTVYVNLAFFGGIRR